MKPEHHEQLNDRAWNVS